MTDGVNEQTAGGRPGGFAFGLFFGRRWSEGVVELVFGTQSVGRFCSPGVGRRSPTHGLMTQPTLLKRGMVSILDEGGMYVA